MALVLGPKARLQFVSIEGPVRRPQLHEARRGAGEKRVGTVILVKRLEDDHFVAGIDDGHHRGHHGFGGAAANGDFALGIDANALGAFEFLDDGVAQALGAPGDGVLVDVVGDGLAGGFLKFRGGGKIRKTLRKIDGIVFIARRVISRITDSVNCSAFAESMRRASSPVVFVADVE